MKALQSMPLAIAALPALAEQQQPGASNGSALTSLGALYDQVPGWLIGFGNKDKARASLQAAHKIDPDGVDRETGSQKQAGDRN